jgi:hypothetical protein
MLAAVAVIGFAGVAHAQDAKTVFIQRVAKLAVATKCGTADVSLAMKTMDAVGARAQEQGVPVAQIQGGARGAVEYVKSTQMSADDCAKSKTYLQEVITDLVTE